MSRHEIKTATRNIRGKKDARVARRIRRAIRKQEDREWRREVA